MLSATTMVISKEPDFPQIDKWDSFETEFYNTTTSSSFVSKYTTGTSEATTELATDASKYQGQTDTTEGFETEFTDSVGKVTMGTSEVISEPMANSSKDEQTYTVGSVMTVADGQGSSVSKVTTGPSEVTTCTSEGYNADITAITSKDTYYTYTVECFETESSTVNKESSSVSKVTVGTSEVSASTTVASSKDHTYTVDSFESDSTRAVKETSSSISKITTSISEITTEAIVFSSKDYLCTGVDTVDVIDTEPALVHKQSNSTSKVAMGISDTAAESTADSCKDPAIDGDDCLETKPILSDKKRSSMSRVTFSDTTTDSLRDLEVGTADSIESESTLAAKKDSFQTIPSSSEVSTDTSTGAAKDLHYTEVAQTEPTEDHKQSSSASEVEMGMAEITQEPTKDYIKDPQTEREERFETQSRVVIKKRILVSNLAMERKEVVAEHTTDCIKDAEIDGDESLETEPTLIAKKSSESRVTFADTPNGSFRHLKVGTADNKENTSIVATKKKVSFSDVNIIIASTSEISTDTSTDSGEDLHYTEVDLVDELQTEPTEDHKQSSSASEVEMGKDEIAAEPTVDYIKYPQTEREERVETQHRVTIKKRNSVSKPTEAEPMSVPKSSNSVSSIEITAQPAVDSNNDLAILKKGSFETESIAMSKKSSPVSENTMNRSEAIADTIAVSSKDPDIGRKSSSMSNDESEITIGPTSDAIKNPELDLGDPTIVANKNSSGSNVKMDSSKIIMEPNNLSSKDPKGKADNNFESEPTVNNDTAVMSKASGDTTADYVKDPYFTERYADAVKTLDTEANRLESNDIEPAATLDGSSCVSRVEMSTNRDTTVVDSKLKEESEAHIDVDSGDVVTDSSSPYMREEDGNLLNHVSKCWTMYTRSSSTYPNEHIHSRMIELISDTPS